VDEISIVFPHIFVYYTVKRSVEKETLVNWREDLKEVKVPLFILPARLLGWYEEGAWAACPSESLSEISTRFRGTSSFLLHFEVYSPSSSSPLSEGEMESILARFEGMIDEFLYSLSLYERLGWNYRFMFSLCLVAYIIGLFSVNTWWFIWFRQPYLALTGVDNWWKKKRLLDLARCKAWSISPGEDKRRQEALDELYSFYTTIPQGDPNYLERVIHFLEEQKKRNRAFSEIQRAYILLQKREQEESYLLKRIAHTTWTKVKRFFLGDLLLIPEVFVPHLCVPIRDLAFIPFQEKEEGDAQNRTLQALQ
jgi:hypothetical protein